MKRVKTSVPTAGLIVLAVVLTSAIGQTGSDRGAASYSTHPVVRELQEAVRRNELRIEQLEARAAIKAPTYLDEAIVEEQAPRREQPSEAYEMPKRIMILDATETVDPDPEAYEELDRLNRDADALQRTVEQMEQRVTSLSGRGGHGSYRGHGYSKNLGASRKRTAEAELLADYRHKLRKKKGEVKRLERELREPKQIIHGHWESMIITLETTRDMSRTLDRIEPGGYLTWDGRRLRHDAESQEWVVTRIQSVDRAVVDLKE
jgi:hypothetical protein